MKIIILIAIFSLRVIAQVPPKIQPFVFPEFVEEGKLIQATCGLETHDAADEFQWFKDGRPLRSGAQWTVLSPGIVSVLVIKSVTIETSGNYTCVARNSAGQDEYTAALQVKDEEFVKISKGSESDGTFTIEGATQNDAGLYICEVTNGIGEDLRKTVRLSIRGTDCGVIFFQITM
ncbi:Down syndrome cell adhesion molecule-like protein 1 [Limulus polyphemus]|uniref:Down syndrome cell adhesion molecule-like protein 1 n=1 Tax=Limulus polyphemus TaxID=6850 RepID=A0ABM1SRB1_LIMPO|nr:Down syndrome cell adhesion molecule-like protein 1 [Limulus polyphemus]